ncbi:ABC transporter ATP-binding protein [Chitinasiproducens palmae]|uniref:NitT/TauT family transport system ATP-binding protein n=1 Tax=Chitinasiproducens palmae TaxID=1770053 RepID=A0A1H2PP61_9BURK|nr:ABC transporter ATP-binding protein [Chitinasiproducens palmae]SDV48043.1 NitT/TauT family transport system ATP-binding protein [Chitinasiproducens palmae]
MSTSNKLAFRAKGLVVTYDSSRGPVKAIDGLDATVADGEFVSILGPSGCGKSTLLKIVSGLLKPSAGTVELGGASITGPRRDIGIVFQQPTLLPWQTVLQNILLPIRTLGLNRTEGRARADALLRLVGLEKFANNYPHELSGGMQQRIGIARGMIHDPGLLLMDEPFAALDAMTREHMMAELQRIWMAAGKSVIFITHSIPEAVFLSDRVLVLSQRPAHLVKDMTIALPRPRTEETMGTREFGEYCTALRALFNEITR